MVWPPIFWALGSPIAASTARSSLGWEELEQIVDPEAARKARQKHRDFNVRYGRAVQNVREQAELKPSTITGISDKQLRRIENGECRVTSNAIEVLSQAHKLKPNEYLQKLAEALSSEKVWVSIQTFHFQ